MSFISWLKHVGHDFKRGLDFILPIAETAGEVTVGLLAPGLGPLFNQTVTPVASAEQKAAALGQQDGSGPQKLADVVQIIGPLIAQALKDAGKDSSAASVTNYINAVVLLLNLTPAPKPPLPPTESQ